MRERIKPTKNDLARVIVQALYNLDELPAKDHHHVVKLSKSLKKDLENRHKRAVAALQKRLEKKEKEETDSRVTFKKSDTKEDVYHVFLDGDKAGLIKKVPYKDLWEFTSDFKTYGYATFLDDMMDYTRDILIAMDAIPNELKTPCHIRYSDFPKGFIRKVEMNTPEYNARLALRLPVSPPRFYEGNIAYCYSRNRNEPVLSVTWEKGCMSMSFWRVSVPGYGNRDINFGTARSNAPTFQYVTKTGGCYSAVESISSSVIEGIDREEYTSNKLQEKVAKLKKTVKESNTLIDELLQAGREIVHAAEEIQEFIPGQWAGCSINREKLAQYADCQCAGHTAKRNLQAAIKKMNETTPPPEMEYFEPDYEDIR